MRVRTDEKRDAILAVAKDVFREDGYERASMAMISARVGGSKATLYSYFKSKDELFAAAMTEAMEAQGDEMIRGLDPENPDLAAVLTRFGRAYLRLLTSPDALAIMRVAVSEGSNSSLGGDLYARGPGRGLDMVTLYMTELIGKGVIRQCNPRIAAAHLLQMMEAGIVQPQLFGAPIEMDEEEVIGTTVEAFIRAYGTPRG
ncbi:TetR/AcrR family transcriptional regulator [Sphingomonas sp.]|uniref:TetR/AcrR family transcriptional regulator n=1 Tax=Sphingomonas sp. TaxID=28214 RepID=UPI002E0F4E26|nr:TetR/AcrR family transcriptional regulator [Sphingomonas sp.]